MRPPRPEIRAPSAASDDAPPAVSARPDASESASHRSGFVALVGRPNVGKSTLLNRYLGRKVAIVTPKPQTTRRRMLGIKTVPEAQVLFIDTPGIHRARDLINQRMVAAARRSLEEADVVVWLVDARAGINATDREIAALLPAAKPVIVALNKIDGGSKARLLPLIREVADLAPGREVVPVSALSGENADVLLAAVVAALPLGPRYYPGDELTDEPERSIVAEIVREKVMLETRQEVPYAVAVTVDSFEEKPERQLVVIKATIHVARTSQKPIVVGQGGRTIRAIGAAARREIEPVLGSRVFLELFVRVQENWTKQSARLREFGL
jgi:GTP-binding protein Era